MYIEINTDEFVEVGDYDPDDEWSQPDSDTFWSFTGAYITEGKPGWNNLSLEIGAEVAPHKFVIIAVWSDGNSFCNDQDRCAEALAAYPTIEDAEAAVLLLSSAVAGDDFDLTPLDIGNGFKCTPPWFGYFETLSYIEILEVT